MNSIHVNDILDAFSPSTEQKEKIYTSLLEKSRNANRVFMPLKLKKSLAVVCAFALIVTLSLGIFPLLQKSNNDNLEFAFSGLNITAYAADKDENIFALDIKLFEHFDKVNITVTSGSISENKLAANSPSITISGNKTLYWQYTDKSNAELTFEAFNSNGDIVSKGILSLETGEFKTISSFPKLKTE